MNSCVIRVLGDSIEPAELLNGTSISPFATFRRGEISAGRVHPAETGGATFDLGSGPLNKLIGAAIPYLARHSKDLKQIGSHTNVESFFIDFGFDSRLDSTTAIQRDFFPCELLALLGDIGLGICISIARTSNVE